MRLAFFKENVKFRSFYAHIIQSKFCFCYWLQKLVFVNFQGATTRQGIILCVLVVLLYLSRVIYNLVAVTVPHDVSSFGFGWINVSDEVHVTLCEIMKSIIWIYRSTIYWVASMAIPVGKRVAFVGCFSFLFFFPCRSCLSLPC